jgi:hypothetical protein
MWLKCITCEVLARPVYYCSAVSEHIIDVELIQRGLHNRPEFLNHHLQTIIDSADCKPYDAILMAYGLCGKATSGLIARSKALIIPKAHDCITLFLGNRARYNHQFSEFPGTYWYSQDYLERDDGSGTSLSVGSGVDTNLENQYLEFIAKYGKDNADYLMEVMGAWQNHYQRAVYIDMGLGNGNHIETRARNEASQRGWSFEKLKGDLNLIRKLIDGEWEEDFLRVEPGNQVKMTFDENIIGCE